MNQTFDICVIGSGAGGGPVAYTLARAGYSVVVLEKGPWFTRDDFFKDELATSYRTVFTPRLEDEQHVVEIFSKQSGWVREPTVDSSWNLWNGNCVGGSTNFMSGFFHRLKPEDFHLKSTFGPIEGSNIADWPISYDDLEPYYTKVESEVGISGRVVAHPNAEPRSTDTFPFKPTMENPLAKWFDNACHKHGLHPIPLPRAVLSRPQGSRSSCSYSGYCGGYGCSTGAKGSSSEALLPRAVATGRCVVQPHAMVFRLQSDNAGKVTRADYYDREGQTKNVRAKIFVVACQAVETSRLLLLSTGPRHSQGLGNHYGQVGKNLIFSATGFGRGIFPYADYEGEKLSDLRSSLPFMNRALQDWYFIDSPETGARAKGGTIDILLRHPDPISMAESQKWGPKGLLWGAPLKKKLYSHFTEAKHLVFEAFTDWLSNDRCWVALDGQVKDKWGAPVAKVRVGNHIRALRTVRYLVDRAEESLKHMGAKDTGSTVNLYPSTNLQAGGCRFGTDPRTSVLDPSCRVHNVDNLYVSDGSFMPTGGSVPCTWTIYANAFRVADKIVEHMGGERTPS